MTSQNLLTGKSAIVTGAASGIGAAIARSFIEQGARVLIVDLPDVTGFRAYSPDVKTGHAAVFEKDVTADGAADEIIEKAVAAFGGIDILVNNAGIALPSTIETTTDEIWRRVMGLNVEAVFRLCRAAIPHLKKSGKGRIINLGSIMSDMAGANLFVYGTSKHAVAGMTKSMAVDLGQYGVTANYLQPGAIVTALSAPFFEDAAFRKYWEDKAPVGRLGQPEDCAAAAVFLATEAAQFISGVGLNVDGGAIVKF
jgi:NAD(P)-dependent dehydrogenase (short-subunit alcohol dehydrogenase family)